MSQLPGRPGALETSCLPYRSVAADLSDAQWIVLEPLLPRGYEAGPTAQVRAAAADRRDRGASVLACRSGMCQSGMARASTRC